MDIISLLPEEISTRILFKLDAQALSACSCVCKSWYVLSNNEQIWHTICTYHGLEHLAYKLPIQGYAPFGHHPAPHFALIDTSVNHTWINRDTLFQSQWKSLYMKAMHLEFNWIAGKYKVQPLLRAHDGSISCIASNDKTIVSASTDKTVKIWSSDPLQRQTVLSKHSEPVTCLAIQGDTLVTGSFDSHVRVYNIGNHRLINDVECISGSITHICIFGSTIGAATTTRSVEVFQIPSGDCFLRMQGHTAEIESLAMDEHDIITTSWDETVRVWSLESGMNTHTLRGHSEAVLCCKFDSSRIISGGADGLVVIWNRQTGEEQSILDEHTQEVYCLALRDHTIASGSADSTIILWSVKGDLLHVLRDHIGIVRFVYFGRRNKLISGGDCKRICIWDYKAGKLLNTAHRQPIEIRSMYVDDWKIITASPYSPGSLVMLNYWPDS